MVTDVGRWERNRVREASMSSKTGFRSSKLESSEDRMNIGVLG